MGTRFGHPNVVYFGLTFCSSLGYSRDFDRLKPARLEHFSSSEVRPKSREDGTRWSWTSCWSRRGKEGPVAVRVVRVFFLRLNAKQTCLGFSWGLGLRLLYCHEGVCYFLLFFYIEQLDPIGRIVSSIACDGWSAWMEPQGDLAVLCLWELHLSAASRPKGGFFCLQNDKGRLRRETQKQRYNMKMRQLLPLEIFHTSLWNLPLTGLFLWQPKQCHSEFFGEACESWFQTRLVHFTRFGMKWNSSTCAIYLLFLYCIVTSIQDSQKCFAVTFSTFGTDSWFLVKRQFSPRPATSQAEERFTIETAFLARPSVLKATANMFPFEQQHPLYISRKRFRPKSFSFLQNVILFWRNCNKTCNERLQRLSTINQLFPHNPWQSGAAMADNNYIEGRQAMRSGDDY